MLLPCCLEELYWAAERGNADLAICAYDRFENVSGHILCQEMRDFPAELNLPPEDDILAFINGSLWNKLIRASCIGTLRIPDFKVGEDISFFMALLECCQKLVFVDEILVHYRVHAASVISNTNEETIYQFADELVRLRDNSSHDWMRATLALVAFIHIGVSMPLRTYGNPSINQRILLDWIFNYFLKNFCWFCDEKWLQPLSLIQHGIKGLGLLVVRLCYRLHCVPLFLALYHWITAILHIEIKF